MCQQGLLPEVFPRRNDNVLRTHHRVKQRQRWPAILNFPKQIREEAKERDSGPQPNPRLPKMLPCRGRQQPKHNPRTEKKHGVFVQNSKASNESAQKPQLWVSAIQNAHHNRRARHPKYRLKRIHREKIVKRQVDWSKQHAKCGEELSVLPTVQFPSQPPTKKYFGRSR